MIADPPLVVLGTVAGVIGGVLVGNALGPGAAWLALVVAVGGLGVALALRPGAARVGVAILAFALLGTAVMQRALHGLVESPLAGAIATRADVRIRGELVEDPSGGRWNAEVLVRVGDFRITATGAHRAGRGTGPELRDGGDRRVLVSASAALASRVRVLEAGDGITVRGWLDPLSGFDTRMRWQHAVGTLHATELVAVGNPESALMRSANAVRALVLAGAEQLEPIDRSLLSGFLVGDTRGLPYSLTEQFRAAGLSHLVAVSGENVAFVLALFAPLFRRLQLRGRLIGGLGLLVLFGTMTRWEPSVLRAITMASLALVAAFLGRPTAGLRVLALAVTALLLADPFLLHSVGFGLSCGASLGIALWSRPLAARLRGPMWMRETLAVTLSAQLGVAPVLIPVFGSMPLVALPANLVAVPLAGPLTVWGLAAGVVSGATAPAAPQFARIVQLPTVGLLHAIRSVADLAARVPIAIDARSAWGCIAIAALAGAGLRTRRSRARASRVGPDGRAAVAVPAR